MEEDDAQLCYTDLDSARNLAMVDFNPCQRFGTVTWDPPEQTKVDKYRVQHWIDGEEEEATTLLVKVPAFTFKDLRPGCRYNIQVACISQLEGNHESNFSKILSFETAPLPPSKLRVESGLRCPLTSFLVKYEDSQSDCDYEVFVKSLFDDATKKVKTKELFANVTDLIPGGSYIVSVRCIKNGIASKQSKLSAPKQTCPEKVKDLIDERSSATSQTISWSSVFGADSYNLKWRRKDGNFKSIPTKDTQITLSQLASGQAFQVCVAAVNPSGIGEYSELKFNTDLAPPLNLEATVANAGEDISAKLHLTAPEQHENLQYIFELSMEAEDEQTPPIEKRVLTTHATFNQLKHCTCYIPCARAVAENGVESRRTFGKLFWTRPPQVANLRNKTMSGNSEKISWKEEDGATSYMVSIQEEGKDPEPPREIKENEITLRNLSLNTYYSASVAAKNQGGIGRYSAAIRFQTALAPPSNIIVSNLPSYPERGILATWDPCDGALRYDIDIIDVKNNKTVDARTAEKCSHEFLRSLEPGQEYRVEIRAVASDGERHSRIEYSKSIWTYCAQVPRLEAKLVSASTVDIGWDRSRGAEGYKVICKSNNGSIIEKTVATNQLTLPNLELGEIFKVTVMPGNQAGYGKESNAKEFRTGFAPVTDVEVTVLNSDSVKIQFAAPQNKPPAYSVLVVQTSDDEELQPKLIKRDHCVITDLKPGIEHVAYVWSTDPEAKDLDSEKTPSKHFFTAPSQVAGVKVIKDSPRSRHIVWDSTAGTSSYVVKLKKAGVSAKSMPPTKRNEFHVDKLDLHSKYSVTVTAQNDGGEGAESDEVRFETELHPPKSIKVTNDLSNPTMALSVRVEETDSSSSHYQLRIINLNGRRDELVKITRQEAMSVKTLGGMTPGDSYQLAICSLHDSDETLNSREKFSSVIQTKTPALTVQLLKISNDKQKVAWSKILEATGSRVSFRTQYGKWQHIDVGPDETETVLENLKSGYVHEIKVIAINRAGPGQESQVQNFTTAPATPVGLDAKILSTREIQVFCDDTYGASTYVFKINGREHETDQPTFTLQHSQLNKHFQIQVFAENEGGCSSPSTICECQQVLLQLQEKFLKKAKNFQEGRFVTPKFKEVPSSNEAIDFGTEEFCVGKGKTVCVVGTDFSGKTACCFQYLCSLSEHDLGMYLDWDDYKDLKANLDIKSILLRQMKDFGESEKNFAIEWMRAHPDQVVFVVDNLVLSHSVAGKLKLWEDIATPQEIFYSLVIPTREIFPECQVLCATSQSDLRQIINPNRTMAIIGFDEKHIKEMRSMIHGEDSEIMLPTHLEYFCKNPAYCKIIFRLLKNPDANVDMKSYSSILLKLLLESVSCYPEGKMKEKLRHLKGEVKNVPQKLKITKVDPSKVQKRTKSKSESATTHRSLTNASEVTSFIEISDENGQTNHSCEALHDYIIKAIFFGLFCPLDEFKNRFHKKSIKLGVNANIWILAAGLLREETVNLAADLFSAIDETLNVKEIAKKLAFTKTFARTNLERIHNQVLSEPVIALDWLNIINEISGLDIIPKSKWKVSVKTKHTPDEIEQMASFLRQVRKMFFGHLRVKLEKDLAPEKRLPIETAMRENPYGEIRVSISESAAANLSRNSLNLSFRSISGRPSITAASPTSPLGNTADETDSAFSETPIKSTTPNGAMYSSSPTHSQLPEETSHPSQTSEHAETARDGQLPEDTTRTSQSSEQTGTPAQHENQVEETEGGKKENVDPDTSSVD